ncbi:MAG: MmgE/PrpD family protein [Dehalococcoidia bacterium]
MTIAGDLAAFVTSTSADAIPPLAFERARMSIASTISSAAMGVDIGSAAITREMAQERGGTPESSIWFDSGPKLPVADVARVNAVMSDAAASDDSDMRNIAHIGTIVSSVGIAMAERLGKSGRDVLHAMTLGYEVAGRIDESLTPGRGEKGFHGSVSTVFGGTVASGILLGLNASQMEHAIAIAATSIGGIGIAANTSWSREYHAGLSAWLGINAAISAQKGFTGEPTVLEAPRGFLDAMGGIERQDITKDLGKEWDIVTDMAIKLVPGGHPSHATAEAARDAAIKGNVNPDDVANIEVSMHRLRTLSGPLHPKDLIGVAHSMSYFIGCAVAERGYGWVHATDASKIDDPTINRLIDLITVDQNPKPDPDRFPHRHGSTVTITMKDGTKHTAYVEMPRGSNVGGVDWNDVDGKYHTLVPLSGMSKQNIDASLEVCHNFEQVKAMSELTSLLKR